MDSYADTLSLRISDLAMLANVERKASRQMRPLLREAALALTYLIKQEAGVGHTAELFVLPGGRE